jgi:CBS domain containing-hemolysin-like protein
VTTALLLLLLVFLSAVFSGCETGLYSLSPLRVEADAGSRRSARIIRWLLRNEYTLLITILVGNNLAIQLLTHVSEHAAERTGVVPPGWIEVVVTLLLAPVVFYTAELLPKELFRLHPHRLVGIFAPLIAAAKILFLPVALPLRLLSYASVRVMRVERGSLSRALGREAVVELFAEGTREGSLELGAEPLALNVLSLRSITLETEMVPWERVETLDGSAPVEEQRRVATASRFSRLPVVGPEGVRGYVHQLDVLRAGPHAQPLDHVRPLPALAPDLSVDRALQHLRRAGQRAALVGTPEAPCGLVTLKDLVETISGDLAGW